MTSNGLEQEQRLSLQVYESHIYVYDEINLYEQLILHFSLSLYRKKVKFRGIFTDSSTRMLLWKVFVVILYHH